MSLVADIIVFIVANVIGVYVFSFGVAQILIVLFCAVPLTNRLRKIGAINFKNATLQSLGTVIFWLVLLAFVDYLVFKFGNTAFIYGALSGIITGLLLGIKQLGINQNNISDYHNSYGRHIKFSALFTESYMSQEELADIAASVDMADLDDYVFDDATQEIVHKSDYETNPRKD